MAAVLHHIRIGSGPPLVLVPGLGGTLLTWKPVLDALAAEREVIAVELPGFGGSPSLDGGISPTPANLAAELADFLAAVGIERPHLAGHSLGGWVTLEMGRRGVARTVTALAPAGLWRRPLSTRPIDSHRVARRLSPLIAALAASGRIRTAMLRTSFADPERIPPDDGKALIRGWLAAPGYEAANREMRIRRLERPEAIRIPVTIAWGDRDRQIGRPRRERMPPGARFIVLEGSGHTASWDDPEGVTRVLLEGSGER